MWQRCTNRNHPGWKYYGGRGVTVCVRWRKFEHFLSDMGNPDPGMTLDRKDNNLGYEPGNCRWASILQQIRNRRNTRRVAFGGKCMTLPEWAKETGLHYGTLSARFGAGWSDSAIVTTPRRRTASARIAS
jgi:hypothetical protein